MMNLLRTLARLLRTKQPRRAPARPPVRLRLEPLEDRELPAQYLWVGPDGGAASTGANWREVMSGTTGVVPGVNDYALYDPALGGANTSCVFDAAFAVDRINMHSSYTATLFVLEGVTVTASTQIDQRGSLVLDGGTISSGGSFYVNGTVAATPGDTFGTSSVLDADAGLYLNDTTTPIAVTGGSAATPGLILSSNAIDCVSDFTLGTAAGASGALSIVGSISALSYSDFTLYTGSYLGFSAGTSGSTFQVQGNITMYDAVISTTGAPLKLDGGDLYSLAGVNNVDVIAGDVTVLNGGTINVGSAAGAVSTLAMTTGSLTVSTSGTVNLYAGTVLTFPAAVGVSSSVTLGGVLNMYGAVLFTDTVRVAGISVSGTLNSLTGSALIADAINGGLSVGGTLNVGTTSSVSRLNVQGAVTISSAGTANLQGGVLSLFPGGAVTVAGALRMYGATLELGAGNLSLSGGTLTSYGSSSGGADTISGSTLQNNGTLTFAGALHSLLLAMDYVQGSSGTLVMRIQNETAGVDNDTLEIFGAATLGGTLTVNNVGGTLLPGQEWTIITTTLGTVGAFATENPPAGYAVIYVGGNVRIGPPPG
jgi:hypothetical protein